MSANVWDSVHKQVPAKVTVYVDEGIKELVELLNQIPKVCTIESCQGSDTHWATVELDYAVNYDNDETADLAEVANFADRLWTFIGQNIQNDIECDAVSIGIEWYSRHTPTIVLRIEPHYIDKLVNILRPLCNEHTHCKPQQNYKNEY